MRGSGPCILLLMTSIPVSKGCYRLLSGLFLLSSLAMVIKGGAMVVPGLISAAICGWAFFSTFCRGVRRRAG